MSDSTDAANSKPATYVSSCYLYCTVCHDSCFVHFLDKCVTVILDQLESAAHALDAAKDVVLKDITALSEVHLFYLIHFIRINVDVFQRRVFQSRANPPSLQKTTPCTRCDACTCLSFLLDADQQT